jgi:hypothetical protein
VEDFMEHYFNDADAQDLTTMGYLGLMAQVK